MMIAELQNQDPTQPMSNSELMDEVEQIRQIESNTELNTTLQSMLVGQNVTTANLMIGQTVTGLDGAGNTITGQVDSVSLANGAATLNIGTNTMSVGNVTAIGQTTSSTSSSGS